MNDMQLSSPRTDRKIAWWASVVFMVVAWFCLAGFLAWALAAGHSDASEWSILEIGLIGVLLLVLALIPFQIRRYFHKRKASR